MARRIQRPDRGSLANLIRETGGNMTRLASLLNVSKPTLYKWVYQLSLDGLAGVGLSDAYGISASPAATEEVRGGGGSGKADNARREAGNSTRAGLQKLSLVNSTAPEAIDPTINTSVRIRQSIWKRMRKAAIDRGTPVASLLESAIQGYLDIEEGGKAKGRAKA